MTHPTLRATVAALALAAGLAHAGATEDQIKQKMETFIGAPVVESVTATAFGKLYEVVLKSGELVYTDAAVSAIFAGNIIDTKTRRNLTEARKNEINAIDFAALPLKDAIKHVRGKGERVIATFEDPRCTYCKRLASDLQTMDNLTVYTFLYPVLDRPDRGDRGSSELSERIWCSADRGGAWLDWIVDSKAPAADGSCNTEAITRNIALGQQFRVGGTPTIFFADGSRAGGYLPADQLEVVIDEAQARRKK